MVRIIESVIIACEKTSTLNKAYKNMRPVTMQNLVMNKKDDACALKSQLDFINLFLLITDSHQDNVAINT